MEDVVLHYRPGCARLAGLLESTERALELFPCRPPPLFTPWFPPAADRPPPIRPSRPPPIISAAVTWRPASRSVETQQDTDGPVISDTHTQAALPQLPPADKLQQPKDGGERRRDLPPATISVPAAPDALQGKRQNAKDAISIPDSPPRVPLASLSARAISKLTPEKDGDGVVRRSWSVLAQKGVCTRSSPPLSKHFHQMVMSHSLHLHQRAKWVISQHNCDLSDIEQVWRLVSRAVQRSLLPTCNANIQRPLAEIWVFCDLRFCEPVGRFLKDELQLVGSISLSVHRLGNVFSL